MTEKTIKALKILASNDQKETSKSTTVMKNNNLTLPADWEKRMADTIKMYGKDNELTISQTVPGIGKETYRFTISDGKICHNTERIAIPLKEFASGARLVLYQIVMRHKEKMHAASRIITALSKHFENNHKFGHPCIGEFSVEAKDGELFVNGEKWETLSQETQTLVFNIIDLDVRTKISQKWRLLEESTCFGKDAEISCPMLNRFNEIVKRCGKTSLFPAELDAVPSKKPFPTHLSVISMQFTMHKQTVRERCIDCDCNCTPFVFKNMEKPDGLVICSLKEDELAKEWYGRLEKELKGLPND